MAGKRGAGGRRTQSTERPSQYPRVCSSSIIVVKIQNQLEHVSTLEFIITTPGIPPGSQAGFPDSCTLVSIAPTSTRIHLPQRLLLRQQLLLLLVDLPLHPQLRLTKLSLPSASHTHPHTIHNHLFFFPAQLLFLQPHPLVGKLLRKQRVLPGKIPISLVFSPSMGHLPFPIQSA